MLSRFARVSVRTSLTMTQSRLHSHDHAGHSCNGDGKIEVMKSRLVAELSPTVLDIQDVSGGCGAFFKMLVVSDKFDGKTQLARHRLVQGILKNDIADMHGLTLTTYTPKQYDASKKE